MGILDDAIREHLDLKRKHGARDTELSALEEDAFGSGDRPDPFSSSELFGEGAGAQQGAAPASEEPTRLVEPEASASAPALEESPTSPGTTAAARRIRAPGPALGARCAGRARPAFTPTPAPEPAGEAPAAEAPPTEEPPTEVPPTEAPPEQLPPQPPPAPEPGPSRPSPPLRLRPSRRSPSHRPSRSPSPS